MFEWSLKNNICKLVDTCAICWNVNNMNFGVMILHPLSTFGRKKLKSENFKYFIHGMEFICYGFRKIIRYSFTICGSPKHQVRIQKNNKSYTPLQSYVLIVKDDIYIDENVERTILQDFSIALCRQDKLIMQYGNITCFQNLGR